MRIVTIRKDYPCDTCEKLLLKGSKVFIISEKHYIFTIRYRYCLDCAVEAIQGEIGCSANRISKLVDVRNKIKSL